MIDDVLVGLSLKGDKEFIPQLIERVKSKAKLHRFSNDKNRMYLSVSSYQYQQKQISFKYWKNVGYYGLPDIYISFHLSQFDSFNQFTKWLRELTGQLFDKIFKEAEVYRLDCCFETLDFDIDYIHQNGRRKYVQLDNLKHYGEFHEV